MAIEGLESIVGAHPVFKGIGDEFLHALADCARPMRFAADTYLFHEDDDAKFMYLVREGHISLEIGSKGPNHESFQTVTTGGLIGLSWMVPPYTWRFDARATEDVKVIEFDAARLREACDSDPVLGYAVLKHIIPAIVERLHHTRVKILKMQIERG